MPDWLAVVILGIIEGVTEFLPVSSTGHLLLVQNNGWLRHQSDLFNVVIQSGAVLAVLAVFTGRVRQLATGWHDAATRDYLFKLGTAFLLTSVGGLALKALDFELPEAVQPVAWATLIGGAVILGIERWLKGRATTAEIAWRVALLVGMGQLIAAVFPGASRSGTTILMALALGVGRPAATEFSFLLGIPTLLAAGGLKIVSEVKDHGLGGENWSLLALGTIVSAVTAFIVVKWLLRFVQSHTFTGFGWYRIALGAVLLAWAARG